MTGRGIMSGVFLEPLDIAAARVDVGQAVRDGRQQRARDLVVERRELIVHPEALFARPHEARPAQIGEMPRRARLGNAQALVDVADADFPAGEQPQNAEARRVAQRLEDRIHRRETGILGRRHIRLDKYNPARVTLQYIRTSEY